MSSLTWNLLRYKFVLRNLPSSDICPPPFCQCEIDKADRGWFRRFHDYSNIEGIYLECPLETDIVKFIIAFAVVCGLLWIAAAVASLLAYWSILEGWDNTMRMSECKKSARVQALVSACLYSIGFVIFLGLFGAITREINAHNCCLSKTFLCEEVKKKFRRSGNEFKGYSICALILITVSTVFTFYSAFSLKSSASVSVSNFGW